MLKTHLPSKASNFLFGDLGGDGASGRPLLRDEIFGD